MLHIVAWVTAFVLSLFVAMDHYTELHWSRRLDRPQAVKTGSSKSVYYIEDGMIHHIPDWNTFVSMGYDVNDIKMISDEELRKYPVGEPGSQIVEETIPDNGMKNCPCISSSGYAAEQALNTTKFNDHLICFVNSTETTTLLSLFDATSLHIHYTVIPDELFALNYNRGFNDTKLKGNISSCDVIIKLTPSTETPTPKYSCPELCVPKPYTELPLSLFLPETQSSALKRLSTTVTCSMTVGELVSEGTVLHHHHTHGHATHDKPVTTSAEGAATDRLPNMHAHLSVGFILRAVARRRIAECSERYYWTPGVSGELDSQFTNPPRRKVHGLIIWTGSRSRYDMVADQIEVLRNHSLNSDYSPQTAIVGWLATEDQYPCRVGSSLCEAVSANNAYYHYMPSTRLNFAAAGYSCAQRRPLRSLAHTLLLFEPNFVLLVDDDTYVGMPALARMDNYIRQEVMTKNIVLGQLTMGRKVTKHGFFYGGAGYLFGTPVIDRLMAHTMDGPTVISSDIMDEVQTVQLSVFNQAAELSRDSCPDCVRLSQGSESNMLNTHANISVRMVEICVNIMAQEHTCYHSDHSITRCLVHGTVSRPVNVNCGGSDLGGATIGMCMGLESCDPQVHLTCHRWRPTQNSGIPYDIYAPKKTTKSRE